MDWWQTLGGGEWNSAELRIVIARDGEKLVGVAPFFIPSKPDAKRSLMFIGSHEIVDYLDFIVEPELLDHFFQGLFAYLGSPNSTSGTNWICSIFKPFTHLGRAKTRSCKIFTGSMLNRPFRKLPLSNCRVIGRHICVALIRNNGMRFAGKCAGQKRADIRPRCTLHPDKERLETDIKDFFRLMAQDPAKESFLTPLMRQQIASTIRCAFDHGCLQLAFLEIGEERASTYMSFDYLNRLWVYNSGVNRQLNEYSPGWVLLGYLLRWANENGYTEFDFMRGDEEYKYRFGATDRTVERVIISR